MTNLFNHSGKATRREFWTTCLISIAMICIFGPMTDMIATPMLRTLSIFGLVFATCWILGGITKKRCHDLGISSWRQFDPRYCLDIPFKKGTT